MMARVKHPKLPPTPKTKKRASGNGVQPGVRTSPTGEVRYKSDAPGFERARKAVTEATEPTGEAAAPALLRAVFGAAKRLEAGDAPEQVAREAARTAMSSPEMMAAFRHALPTLEAAVETVGGAPAKNVAASVLEPLADGKKVQAVLKAAYALGGVPGRRLVGAALRGLHKGGLAASTAEVAATAAKIGSTSVSLGTVGKALGRAAPLVGNPRNLLMVGSALAGLIGSFRDSEATTGKKLGHALHLACSVVGCFIPAVGVAGGVALGAAAATGAG